MANGHDENQAAFWAVAIALSAPELAVEEDLKLEPWLSANSCFLCLPLSYGLVRHLQFNDV